MSRIDAFFVTEVYRDQVEDEILRQEIEALCRSLAVDDQAGIRWCRKNTYPGYTSYASLADLPWRFPAFKQLVRLLDRHVQAYAKLLEFELKGRKLSLDSLWVNILPPGGSHAGHLHPQSVISGTYYVTVPEGAGSLRFEDPRLGLMMAAPLRKPRAELARRRFVSVAPEPGTVLLWESWLRHDVPPNQGTAERISVSFNYRCG